MVQLPGVGKSMIAANIAHTVAMRTRPYRDGTTLLAFVASMWDAATRAVDPDDPGFRLIL